jgi:hypothetical protein
LVGPGLVYGSLALAFLFLAACGQSHDTSTFSGRGQADGGGEAAIPTTGDAGPTLFNEGGGPSCANTCGEPPEVMFDLSCASTDLESMTLSGACAMGDGGPTTFPGGYDYPTLYIYGTSAGVCHVLLAFASGFMYSDDLTFVSQTPMPPAGCPACPTLLVPSASAVLVHNPPSTCVDAGSATSSDAGAD